MNLIISLSGIFLMEGLVPNWFEDVIQHEVRSRNERTFRISGIVGKVRRLEKHH